MIYKMALKVEEFNVNYITAVGGLINSQTLDIKTPISFRELSFMEE